MICSNSWARRTGWSSNETTTAWSCWFSWTSVPLSEDIPAQTQTREQRKPYWITLRITVLKLNASAFPQSHAEDGGIDQHAEVNTWSIRSSGKHTTLSAEQLFMRRASRGSFRRYWKWTCSHGAELMKPSWTPGWFELVWAEIWNRVRKVKVVKHKS